MAVQGAARKGDQVTHTQAMNGMLLGVGLGVLAVAGAALVVGTGGIGLPFVLGAAAVIGGGGLFGEAMGATEPPAPCGPILEGVPSIIIGPDKKQAAMATAHVHCDQHSSGTVDETIVQVAETVAAPLYALYSAVTSGSGPQIAEGSSTVFLSDKRLMAARMGDKGTCGFVIGEGLPTVIIGGPTGTAEGLSVDGEVPKAVNVGLTALMFAPAVVEVVTAGSVGLGVLALGRVGVGLLGAAVGSEALGALGEHYFGPKGKVVGQFVGGFLGGYGASRGAGKALETGPVKAAAGKMVDGVDGFARDLFGGGRAGGGVASVPEGSGGTDAPGGSGAPPPAAEPGGPLPGGRTQAEVDRINADWEARRQGMRRGDDLPGRGVQSMAQDFMDAISGRRPRPAFAGAGGGGLRGVFDEGGGVFSPKKGSGVMKMAAEDPAGGGATGGGTGGGSGRTPKPIPEKLVPGSTHKQTISLQGDSWKKTTFPNDDKGIIYLLKDADTGEVLKVGKTETENFRDRFRFYKKAADYTGRHLELDLHTVPGADEASFESVEKGVRKELEANGHSLPWDNTKQPSPRLGREGPGVPGTRLSRASREKGIKWQGEKLVDKNGVELVKASGTSAAASGTSAAVGAAGAPIGSTFDDGGGPFAPKNNPAPRTNDGNK